MLIQLSSKSLLTMLLYNHQEEEEKYEIGTQKEWQEQEI